MNNSDSLRSSQVIFLKYNMHFETTDKKGHSHPSSGGTFMTRWDAQDHKVELRAHVPAQLGAQNPAQSFPKLPC